jgi:hypothetical protein
MTQPARGRVLAYMLALFIGGGITGAAIMSFLGHGTPPQSLKLGRVDEITVLIREKLNTRLSLTAEQSQKFEPFIKRASEELEASHLDCLKRISAAIDMLHVQIAPELTAEQKEKLKLLETERTADMRAKYNYSLDTARTNAP